VSRKYFGENEAHDLIAWLNRYGGTSRGKPVLKLWEAFNDFRQFLIQNGDALVAEVSEGIGIRPELYPSVDPKSKRRFRRLAEENVKKWLRAVRRAWNQCGVHATALDFAGELRRRNLPDSVLVQRRPQSSERKSRSQAAFDLVVLTYQPAFDRIRQCLKCRKFFYGRFKHKKFCSDKCQQAYYKQSPEWKAHRADWMRDYRRIKSTTNVK
jgi:hypothetical protein